MKEGASTWSRVGVLSFESNNFYDSAERLISVSFN